MWISLVTEKVFEKSNIFSWQNTQQTRNKRQFPPHNKGHWSYYIEAIMAQHCEYTKCYWIVHFQTDCNVIFTSIKEKDEKEEEEEKAK